MRTVYIADNGREFDDIDECAEYEFDLNFKNNTLVMLDENGKLLDSSNKYNLDTCCYIRIADDKDLKLVQDSHYNYTEYEIPEEIGDFYYNDEGWYLIDDKIEKLENELNKLKNIKEKFNEYSNKKS